MPRKPYEKAAEETAKATQALAKLGIKGIDAANALGGFFEKVIGGGLTHLGAAFEDWAGTFRYLNALKLADKVHQAHVRRGISRNLVPIPPRLGIPLLQRAFLEDDDALQEMWAGLIVNATDPDRRINPRRGFIDLLSALEPLDALVLKEIQNFEIRRPNRVWSPGLMGLNDENNLRAQWPNLQRLTAALGLQKDEIALALENIARLELASDKLADNSSGGGIGAFVPITHSAATIELTHTGRALLAACTV